MGYLESRDRSSIRRDLTFHLDPHATGLMGLRDLFVGNWFGDHRESIAELPPGSFRRSRDKKTAVLKRSIRQQASCRPLSPSRS